MAGSSSVELIGYSIVGGCFRNIFPVTCIDWNRLRFPESSATVEA